MMTIGEVKFGALHRMREDYRRFAEGKGLAIAAEVNIQQIHRRSEAGRDFHGRPMREYSRGYKYTRKRKGLRVSPPNLMDTGEMLDSIGYNAGIKAVHPSVDQMQKAKWNQALRPFMGASPGTRRMMIKEVRFRAPQELRRDKYR